MCGLAFHYSRHLPPHGARAAMERCLEAMHHRGPDDGRIVEAAGAVLGHRRLSIIDLAESTQPMGDPSGRYVLAYNGEIYNYPELREALAPHWDFRTHGDTEVLLAGLVLHGPGFLARCEGMWAFALWDSLARRLLLGRDRMGKKPLFVTRLTDGGLACASEIPALRKLADKVWHEDADTVADILRYGYALPGTTAWQEVTEILPGHTASWQPGGQFAQQAYWSLQPRQFDGTPEHARRELRDKLVAAVRRRMIADVEVGAFLSGGVDSTLICSIIRRELGLPLKTFTIGFTEAAFDERQYARLAADAIGSEHHEEVLTAWDESRLERLLLDHVGQPFADSSLLPTALVSEVAARHVKVALSGDGGDELFSGYERYQARNILRWYSRLPAGLRHLAENAIRHLPETTAHHSRSLLKKSRLFLDVIARQTAETPYFAPLLLAPQQLGTIAPDLAARGHPPPGIPEQTEPHDIARMMLADALIYLPQDILVKVDRASMAHSLETRSPFLDRTVVELAFSLPLRWHRSGMKGKQMLRQTFQEFLPARLWNRRKQGFGVPIHTWFRGELGNRLLELASDTRHAPVDAQAISTLLDQHRAGINHGYRLWVLYSYLLWRSRQT